VAKVEWHPGELYPRVGVIVTNLARRAEPVVACYDQRGTAEQHIKEGKNAIKWARLSCRTFAANAVRLQLLALAYNLGNFMRTLAIPKTAEAWSLTSLREKLDPDWRESRKPWAVRHIPDGRGRGVASAVQRNFVADRPAAGAARASMTKAGVRCDGRRCGVRLGKCTVTSSDTTRRRPIVSDGQQNTRATAADHRAYNS
jgi:hypothetical protein